MNHKCKQVLFVICHPNVNEVMPRFQNKLDSLVQGCQCNISNTRSNLFFKHVLRN